MQARDNHLCGLANHVAGLLDNDRRAVIGGGVSKYYGKFGEYLRARARIVPAQSLNEAGIIGAAMAAAGQG